MRRPPLPSRRNALARLGYGLATMGALTLPARVRAAGVFEWPLGVQLWSVKAELDRDVPGTLRRLFALGYREVETAGLHGLTADAMASAVREAGLTVASAHFPMDVLLREPDASIRTAATLGARWITCSSPQPSEVLPGRRDWMAEMGEAMTAADWRRTAAGLNALARRAKPAGLRVAYHNHTFEFARSSGPTGYARLLRDTDPSLVALELDVAWAVAGGEDPIALLAAHGDRFRLMHIKDVPSRPSPGTMAKSFATADVGTGAIDWRAVLTAAGRAGVEHAFVEQEAPYRRPVFESLATARDYLASL